MADNNIQYDLTTFNDALRAIARTGDLDQTFAMFDSLVNYQFAPNTQTCNALIEGCVLGETIEGSERAFNVMHMMERQNIPFDAQSGVLLLRACNIIGDSMRAVSVMEFMHTHLGCIRSDMIGEFITVCRRTENGLEAAVRLLQIRRHLPQSFYVKFFESCLKHDAAALAYAVFNRMRLTRMKLTEKILVPLLRVLLRSNQPQLASNVMASVPNKSIIPVQFKYMLQQALEQQKYRIMRRRGKL